MWQPTRHGTLALEKDKTTFTRFGFERLFGVAQHHSEDEDDDFELELEAVDPEILEHARQRASRQIEETEIRAARLETYDEPSEADTISLDQLEGFRFTTSHLLIATALLAIVMTVVKLGGGCNGLFFSALGALAFGWWFVLRKEKQERLERERRRAELDARLAEGKRAITGTPPVANIEDDYVPSHPSLHFSFSLKQILGALAVAAVVLTMASLLGTGTASLFLGIVAVAGLAVFLLGFELPGIIVFGWWVLLAMYVVMSLLTIVSNK